MWAQMVMLFLQMNLSYTRWNSVKPWKPKIYHWAHSTDYLHLFGIQSRMMESLWCKKALPSSWVLITDPLCFSPPLGKYILCHQMFWVLTGVTRRHNWTAAVEQLHGGNLSTCYNSACLDCVTTPAVLQTPDLALWKWVVKHRNLEKYTP